VIVSGVAEGCIRAHCALLGGETAEHPGTLEPGRFDLAGFCVGVLRRDDLLGPGRVGPGDALLGLASTGLHANGFSLVREALREGRLSLEVVVPSVGRSLGEALLEPTAIYVEAVMALVREGLARSAAHVTGGGWTENLPRALPDGLTARIDRSAWTPPPIFEVVAEAAGLGPDALFGVFNMGIGMVVVVSPSRAARAIEVCASVGVQAVLVGHVVRAEDDLSPE
jgi:phosphoribosylformylglycinamidine cyclo-ligase